MLCKCEKSCLASFTIVIHRVNCGRMDNGCQAEDK
jgi:hypothetical protein